jgi:CubicO group peptidase (beta-lactamase class C family)
MRKIFQSLLLFFALAGCNKGAITPTVSPNARTATASLTPAQVTPTLIPSETPTQTPYPAVEIHPLIDNVLKYQIDLFAKQYLQGAKNSGLSISFVKRNPQTGLLEAMLLNYGLTAKEGGSPIASETIYEIGSISKILTGILLAESVNNGTVKLDDPIQKYFPPDIHAPMYRDIPIKIIDLAIHRSALPRDSNSDDITDIYLWLDKYELSHSPGSQYVYTNFGFTLLGDFLVRLSGKDFDSLEFQSISQPLGMMDTREILSDAQKGRLANGYNYDGSLASPFPDSGAMGPAGYLRSTLTDMTRFLIANMQPDSTPLASSLKLAQTMQGEGRNPGSGVGLGWEISQPGTPDERIWTIHR